MNRRVDLWLLLVVLLCVVGGAAGYFLVYRPAEGAMPSPRAELSPADVVRIQLEALQNNDADDSGIEVCFRFASPGNQSKTGPLERFAMMVHSPQYLPMLNFKQAVFGPLESRGEQARQGVKLTAADGSEAVFLFILTRQKDKPYEGCWMTDGVIRLAPDVLTPPQPPPGGEEYPGLPGFPSTAPSVQLGPVI